ncbi:MAG TPA: hypothetical protein VHS76_16585 [Steroidobacteraceae bacterium]|jgi:hypothetical protein|nr:hypothetical protein [Steroidobacteraceae bacterium]
MLRLVKAFLDIALRRQTPAVLPASLFLFALVAGVAALSEVLGALLSPPPGDAILMGIVLGVGLPVAFTWVLLTLTRRRARFLQTATALLGVGALAGFILYPLNSLVRLIGVDKLLALPIGVLWTAVFIGYLLACAHIWRAAFDSGLVLGGIISIGYFLLAFAIEQQVLPQS